MVKKRIPPKHATVSLCKRNSGVIESTEKNIQYVIQLIVEDTNQRLEDIFKDVQELLGIHSGHEGKTRRNENKDFLLYPGLIFSGRF